MSVTGPGCAPCGFTGRVRAEGSVKPCDACGGWSQFAATPPVTVPPPSSTPPTLAALTAHARAHGWTDDRGRRWGCWWATSVNGPRLVSLRQDGALVCVQSTPGYHLPHALARAGETWRAVDAAGLACGCGTAVGDAG